MSRFISLEGLCGVGKTTTSELVASALNVQVTDTIPQAYNELRKQFNPSDSLDARFLFFLSAVAQSATYIEEQLEQGVDVVVESYLYRTIAFHQGMGSQFNIQIPKSFLTPTHTIRLVCEQSERQRRLQERGERVSKWDYLSEIYAEQIDAEYDAFALQTLDVTHLTPKEACDAVLELVKQELQNEK